MQELWLCERCKSINRAQTTRCYSCGAGREVASRVMETIEPRPVEATVSPRVMAAEGLAAREAQPHVPTRALGMLSVVLLAGYMGLLVLIALVTATSIATAIALEGRIAIDEGSNDLIRGIAGVTAVVGLAALVCHSAYLAVVNLDVPWLGGMTPRYSPIRAGLFWVQAYGFAIVGQLAFWIPVAFLLFFSAFGLFGIVAGVGWFVLSVQLFGDPVAWFTRPGRVLRDLTDSLALPGTEDGRLVNYWAASWLIFHGIFLAVAALIIVAILALDVANMGGMIAGGRPVATTTREAVVTFLDAITALVTIVEAIAWAATIGLTMWLTVVMSQRIGERELLAAAESARAGTVGEAR